MSKSSNELTNLHSCTCVVCGKPVLLGFDNEKRQYVAMCDNCKTFSYLSDCDNPPFQQ